MRSLKFLTGVLVSLVCLALAVPGQSQTMKLAQEPACQTLTPASAGGPMPRNADVMVMRYLGMANYEVAYQGKVLLLDTYYDGSRPPGSRIIGLKASDVTRADAIFVGHPHGDHIQDAPDISKRTGAVIFVAPAGRPFLENEKVPADHIKYVRGGETIKMDGYTVTTALAIHSSFPPELTIKSLEVLNATSDNPLTDEQLQRRIAGIRQPRAQPADPDMDILHHGTIAYVLTFDSGFRLAFRDSPGAISDGERKLMDSIHGNGGKVDLAVIAYQGLGPSYVIRNLALPLVKLYNPSIFLPAHHDQGSAYYPIATAPLFLTFREQMPNTRGYDPLYRSPVCIDTKTVEVHVNDYPR
ncbi:MAG: MBL fold metallo-hydrolase [Gemmatimonadetes bacterium]|nr:MBL fold metallo-hydrolase [Gemmatimonadota bacterium]